MVHLHEQANTSSRQAREEPHLPQGPGAVQRTATQRLAGTKQLRLVPGGGDREDPDVFGDVEGGSVDPQWPAQPESGPVQDLMEAGKEVRPSLDLLSGGLDPDATVRVEQASPVEDGERTDVLGPTLLFGPDQHEIGRGQPLD